LTNGDAKDVFTYVTPITVVGISVFSVFFIIYANTAFVKGRNKEFGVYMTLGMNKKDIKKLVAIENLILSSVSLIIGILAGALFSRLFQMIIVALIDVDNVTYHLDYKSFIATILTFILVFAAVFLKNNLRLGRIDINTLLKESRVREGKDYRKSDGILGIIGLVAMLLSVFALVIISANEKLIQNTAIIFAYLILMFGGIYFVISRGGNLLINWLKKIKPYGKGMLAIAGIHQKFNQNKRILFVLSVLSSITVVCLASPFSLLSVSESIAEMNPNTIEYVETGHVNNNISSKELEAILNEKPGLSHEKVGFVELKATTDGKQQINSIPVISAADYSKYTGTPLSIKQGECNSIIVTWQPGNHGIEPKSKISLRGKKSEYNFYVAHTGHDKFFAGQSYPSNVVLVVNDADFKKLYADNSDTATGYYHLINYSTWRDTGDIVNKLKAKFGKSDYPVLSVFDTYTDLKKGYSTMLFVFTILSVLFFISGGTVLYFRQYIELPQTKANFDKLFKLGLTKKEAKSTIKKELRVIFFIPIIFGAFAGVSLIYLLTNLVGGSDVLKEFMSMTVKVVIVYFLSQCIFYLLTLRKYSSEITGSNNAV
jgi:putative ABC transport system permease protein